jgi:hypothetical protein
VGINPLVDVERLQLLNGERSNCEALALELDERLDVAVVPLERPLGLGPFRDAVSEPVEEGV